MTLEPLPAYDHFEDIRGLFLEYARWLAVPLEFQGFSAELDTLPGKYAPPEGRLYLGPWRTARPPDAAPCGPLTSRTACAGVR